MRNIQQRDLYLTLVILFWTSSLPAGAQLRLTGTGSTQCSGRVEIFFDSTWGTVCDDEWDLSDAEVVCRQLNCGTALSAPGGASFGEGSGPILLDDVDCSGREVSLTECQHRGYHKHDCKHNEDAGVVCSGAQLRLVGSGSTQCLGRVEIFLISTWGTVCDDEWDLSDAEVVCRQLNCGTALSAPGGASFGEGSGPILLNDVDCSGRESSLMECQHKGYQIDNCGHHEDAGVVCSGHPVTNSITGAQIRLTGSGSTQCSGRVEIVFDSTWGTVCDDEWDLSDAEVVCRQLNCGTALSAPGGASFGEGSGPILLDDVDCSGREVSLTECQHRGYQIDNCGHQEDAGVVCSGHPVTKSTTEVTPVILLLAVIRLVMILLLMVLFLVVVVHLICRRRQQAKQPILVHNKLPVRVGNDDAEDYVNVVPVETKKNLIEETDVVDEENINEEPDAVDDHVYEEEDRNKSFRKVKVCFSVDEKRHEKAENSQEEDNYVIVLEPLTEQTVAIHENHEDI